MEFPVDDLKNHTIVVLGLGTKEVLSYLLNPYKLIKNENGLSRDWRGLAELCSIPGEHINSLANKSDPTKEVLNIWRVSDTNPSAGNLLDYLEILDRSDVVDDIRPLIETDIAEYLRSKLNRNPILRPNRPIQSGESPDNVDTGPDHYDAILLYAYEDIEFAKSVLENMETKWDLHLFDLEREIIAGDFHHSVVAEVISNRCDAVITICSNDLFSDNAQTFYNSIALALNIEKGRRRLIPVIYKENVNLPAEFIPIFKVDFTKKYSFKDNWEQLANAIRNQSRQPNSTKRHAIDQQKTASASTTDLKLSAPLDIADSMGLCSSSTNQLSAVEAPTKTTKPSESENCIDQKKTDSNLDKKKLEKKQESSFSWLTKLMPSSVSLGVEGKTIKSLKKKMKKRKVEQMEGA